LISFVFVFVSGLALGSIAAVGPTQATPSRADVPPILLNGENGILGLFVYLGPSMQNTSIPMMGVMPVKVCDGSDCETYNANYLSDNEGYSLHRFINFQIDVGVRFGKRAVTAQVPSDLVDGSNGWSAASNAVTGWTDSLEWFRSRSNRPMLEVQFGAIESTSITRADLCANYREGQSLTRSISGFSAFDLVGYTAIRYVITENGTQIKSEDLSASLSSMTSIPACGGGIMGSGLIKNIDGLSAGKSYKLIYTLSGTGKTDVTASLDFVTPGACPAGEIVLSPSPRAFYYGVLGTDGLLKSYLATGTFPWRLESILGERIAPIYFSASKVGPYKGKLLNVRTSTEKWRYVREMDDWALVVDNATPVPASGVLAYTVFADCASTSVKPTLSLNETNIKAADQACIIEANEVVPTKAGQCIVKAQISSPNAATSGIRKQASSNTVTMNYVFASVGTFSRTPAGTTSGSLVNATPGASSTCSVVLSATKKTTTRTALLKCAGLSKKKSQTVSLKVASRSAKVCTVNSSGLARLAKGSCKVTVRLVSKSRVVSSRLVTIPVR
jgi:hypothetical protein